MSLRSGLTQPDPSQSFGANAPVSVANLGTGQSADRDPRQSSMQRPLNCLVEHTQAFDKEPAEVDTEAEALAFERNCTCTA
jgi:hypothetical protein